MAESLAETAPSYSRARFCLLTHAGRVS